MNFDSLYRERVEIKSALKTLGLTQGEFARRNKIPPSTFTNKVNGLSAMDEAEEKKILADLAAMMEAV